MFVGCHARCLLFLSLSNELSTVKSINCEAFLTHFSHSLVTSFLKESALSPEDSVLKYKQSSAINSEQ